jgi:hypothetical protein
VRVPRWRDQQRGRVHLHDEPLGQAAQSIEIRAGRGAGRTRTVVEVFIGQQRPASSLGPSTLRRTARRKPWSRVSLDTGGGSAHLAALTILSSQVRPGIRVRPSDDLCWQNSSDMVSTHHHAHEMAPVERCTLRSPPNRPVHAIVGQFANIIPYGRRRRRFLLIHDHVDSTDHSAPERLFVPYGGSEYASGAASRTVSTEVFKIQPRRAGSTGRSRPEQTSRVVP